MSLSVLNMTPVDGSINLPLDSTFLIEFDSPIDPFTVKNGISLYTISTGLWTGPDLAILDTSSNSLDNSPDEFIQYQFNYTLNGNQLFIKPTSSLVPERQHYISIFPGDDTSRFISSVTVSEPIYLRSASASGTLEIVSSYTGNTNDTFVIDILSGNRIDVTKGAIYVGEFTYQQLQEVDLGELKVSFSGSFDIGDSISIDVFKASGLTSIYKTTFETSKYNTLTPESTSLTVPPGNILDQLQNPMRIVKTIPDNVTFNNVKYNPITIKFNRPIKSPQELMDKIKIKRIDMILDQKRDINFYYKINNDTLKIFLLSVSK
jgi:hypothetical protein